MAVESSDGARKRDTRLRRFKKRMIELLSTLVCCFPLKKNNKVAPGDEVVDIAEAKPVVEAKPEAEAEVDEVVTEVASAENVEDKKEETPSLTPSENIIADAAVELALKNSQSSALDDLL